MTRFANNRAKGASYKGKISPKLKKRLEIEVSEARKWVVKWAGAHKFEVGIYLENFVVDLQASTCSCNF